MLTLCYLYGCSPPPKTDLESGEEEWQEDDESRDDPDDQDSFVADVEEGEPHVRRQLLHRLHELFHRQLKFRLDVDSAKY